jgi:2,5-diketo-D-gluconate reductase A
VGQRDGRALTMTRLTDGWAIPDIGFGTYPLVGEDAERATLSALEAGYRMIDTAASYGNEGAVGAALSRASVPRSEIVVATKLRGRDHGYDTTLAAFEQSRRALGLDYVDVYLIHWPNPSVGKYVDSCRAMIQLQSDGLVRSIGVSNFTWEFIQRLVDSTGVAPSINQVELHPSFPQAELRARHDQAGIATVAWSPLGTRPAGLLAEEPIRAAARARSVTPAQVVMRWHHQLRSIAIPKSENPDRQRENLAFGEFELSEAEAGCREACLWSAQFAGLVSPVHCAGSRACSRREPGRPPSMLRRSVRSPAVDRPRRWRDAGC